MNSKLEPKNVRSKFILSIRRFNFNLGHDNYRYFSPASNRYESALEECQKYYINLRQQIIGPSLRDSINELVTSRVGDYCSLLRLAATQLIYLSQDEDKLYFQFFTKPSTVFT